MQATNRLFSQNIYTNTPLTLTGVHTCAHAQTHIGARTQRPSAGDSLHWENQRAVPLPRPERKHTQTHAQACAHDIAGRIRVKVSVCDRVVRLCWQTAALRCTVAIFLSPRRAKAVWEVYDGVHVVWSRIQIRNYINFILILKSD